MSLGLWHMRYTKKKRSHIYHHLKQNTTGTLTNKSYKPFIEFLTDSQELKLTKCKLKGYCRNS